MSFLSNPLKWLLNKLPMDDSDRAGWGPFSLPEECNWMQRAARLHDIDYARSDVAPTEKRRSESDFDLFWRWALEASKHPDPIERCKRAAHICKYWGYARTFGQYFWSK